MLGTVIKVTKLISVSYSCVTIEQTAIVYNWITRLDDEQRITHAEYFLILDAINETQKNIKRKGHKNLYV